MTKLTISTTGSMKQKEVITITQDVDVSTYSEVVAMICRSPRVSYMFVTCSGRKTAAGG